MEINQFKKEELVAAIVDHSVTLAVATQELHNEGELIKDLKQEIHEADQERFELRQELAKQHELVAEKNIQIEGLSQDVRIAEDHYEQKSKLVGEIDEKLQKQYNITNELKSRVDAKEQLLTEANAKVDELSNKLKESLFANEEMAALLPIHTL